VKAFVVKDDGGGIDCSHGKGGCTCTAHVLHVTVLSADGLKGRGGRASGVDVGQRADPYVTLDLLPSAFTPTEGKSTSPDTSTSPTAAVTGAAQKRTTEPTSGSLHPVWNDAHFTFSLPLFEGPATTNHTGAAAADALRDVVLRFRVWDRNSLTGDVGMGETAMLVHPLVVNGADPLSQTGAGASIDVGAGGAVTLPLFHQLPAVHVRLERLGVGSAPPFSLCVALSLARFVALSCLLC
jgi:hypothetical protein